ncbi:glycerol-3-phosphate 1-O-acyltransferase PlsB [Coralloluteibacterium thermophilus]|uniref:Glycerol-3-phosphate acyltransferase n=1 Tax=Coralloluteibacterium thermophilum TaxID=2707049 RepID=A0ABV9NK59_9GAMM
MIDPTPRDPAPGMEQPRLPLDAPAGTALVPARPPYVAPPPRPSLWRRFLGQLLEPWIALKREPAQPAALLDPARPVCYVVEHHGLSNALILERACREAGLPSPLSPLPHEAVGRRRSYVVMSQRRRPVSGRPVPRTQQEGLARLLDCHLAHPDLDVQLVPVSIFVGRAPDRQTGWFQVLFSENWAIVGRFRRLLAILLNGRNTIVQFSPAFPVRDILAEGLPPERSVRKLGRVLRAHFRRIRAAVIGPDLSHRRLFIDRILDSEPVRRAIDDQARRDNTTREEAWKKAHAFAWEIAADYSHPVVRSLSFLLTPFWNRMYDGVTVRHMETLKEVAPGHEVVYTPSHRSHIDYLLLSYILYGRGVVPPHIVAGVNLNMPVIGSLLRRGGAFFIRRSIRGNALYSTVLSEYVAQLIGEGFSIEYFVEGGRSRTGRMLAPKGGMVSMTVRAFLRAPRRPVVFVPVYIGYEKVMEGESYLDELTGRPKQKETVWALLKGVAGILRRRYGKVALSFGEPIHLDEVLARHAPGWKDADPDAKPEWLGGAVDEIAERIVVNINSAADVNPVNLLALALLATPRRAMGEADLVAQLALAKTLLAAVPYSERVTVTPLSPAEIIDYGERIGVLTRTRHPLGDVIGFEPETAVLQSYYRNNVLHLFVAAAWIACCFQNSRRMSRAGVLRLGRALYPFIQGELFLPWDEDGFAARLERTIDVFVAEGLLTAMPATEGEGEWLTREPGQTDEVFRLRAIAHSLQQAFERYYIAIAILVKNGPGALTAAELETLCQLTAQRLSLLYAPAAPEFFDKSLFRGFIQRLRGMGLVRANDEGKLVFDERLDTWAKDARVILGRELRATIMTISPEAARAEASPAA